MIPSASLGRRAIGLIGRDPFFKFLNISRHGGKCELQLLK
jgi:hypothetical protein